MMNSLARHLAYRSIAQGMGPPPDYGGRYVSDFELTTTT